MSAIQRHMLALTAAILFATPAVAALPPQYQRMVELHAVLDAADAGGVPDQLGEIIGIAHIGPDLYEIYGDTCTVLARIVSTPQKGPPVAGPRQFEVRLDPPVCR